MIVNGQSNNGHTLAANMHFFFHSQLLPNPLDGNDAPAPVEHFHDSIVLIRADLTELRSNKETSVEVDKACCIYGLMYSLFDRSSVKSTRIKKVE